VEPPRPPEARPYHPAEHPEIPLPAAMPLPEEGRRRAEPPRVNSSEVTASGQFPTVDPTADRTGGGRRRRRPQSDTAYPLGGRNWATGEQRISPPPAAPPAGRRRAPEDAPPTAHRPRTAEPPPRTWSPTPPS